MSELWIKILNQDIQESKITLGDTYRINQSLIEVESKITNLEKALSISEEALKSIASGTFAKGCTSLGMEACHQRAKEALKSISALREGNKV